MTVRTKRSGRPRAPAIQRITEGLYVGSKEVIEEIVTESAHVPAWRPVRAAAVRALAVKESVQPWMWPAEFWHWAGGLRRGERGVFQSETGIAPARRKAIMHGAPISPSEALAIAHYRAGLPVPIELESAAFETWFMPRFGAARPVARVLCVNPETLTDQMRGYALTSGGRALRKPDITLVRALDWVWRVGPFSPYGDRLGEAFPGQLKEEDQP